MQTTRIIYDPMLHHWSCWWLRWLGTVRGLWVWTAIMSVVAIYAWPVDGRDGVVHGLLLLAPVAAIVRIVRHLRTREQEPGRETPDASMRVLFEVAWILVLILIVLAMI